MAITSETFTVASNAATLLSPSTADGVPGHTLYVNNKSAVTVYIGPFDVTGATNGYPIPATSTLPWPVQLADGEGMWAIAASATASVTVLRTGV